MFVPFKFEKFEPGMQLFLRRIDGGPDETPSAILPISRITRVPAGEGLPDILVLFFQDGTTSALIEETSISLGGLYQYLVEVPDKLTVVFFERVAGYVWTFNPPRYQGGLPVFDTHEEALGYAKQVVEDRREVTSRPLIYVIHNVSELFQE